MAIGFKGIKEDLILRKGADFGPALGTIRNQDGSPFDLTGCTLRATIVKGWTQEHPTMMLLIDITDALEGKFSMYQTAESTEVLDCGDSESNPKSQYLWQLDVLDSTGRIIPLSYGLVSVFRKLADQ